MLLEVDLEFLHHLARDITEVRGRHPEKRVGAGYLQVGIERLVKSRIVLRARIDQLHVYRAGSRQVGLALLNVSDERCHLNEVGARTAYNA